MIIWFWSRPPPPPPPETVWFPEATDHNFEGIVFIFGIHLWGVKVSPPIENGQGWVISPGVGGPKTTQITHFFIFFIVWLKNILPHRGGSRGVRGILAVGGDRTYLVITYFFKNQLWYLILPFFLRSNLGQKPKNIAISLKIFICRTICARVEQKAVL
jgi:hypothetical protein